MQSFILLSLAASAFAAPFPGAADTAGASGQVAGAVGGLVAAAAPVVANAAANVGDVKATDNSIGNGDFNYNYLDILRRTGVATTNGATKQVGGAVGGLAAVAAPVAANVAAVAGSVDVVYNTIGDDDANGNFVDVLRRAGVATTNGATKQVGGAVGGLAAVAAPVAANAAAVVGSVDVVYNSIGNNDANNNNIHALKRAVSAATGQAAGAVAGLAAVAAPVVANIDAVAGKVNVEDNSILNNDGNGNNVHVGRGAADVSGATGQLAGAVGAVAAAVPATVNAAADVLDVTVADNSILTDDLNDNNIHVFSRDGVSSVSGATGQLAGAAGLVAAAVPVVANAAATVGTVDVVYNEIADNTGNGNNVHVARSSVDAASTQVGTSKGGVAVTLLTVVNLVLDALHVNVINNEILDNFLDENFIHIL